MITRRNVFTVLLLACATQASAAVETPAGDWRTFDDHTGLERSLIRIEVNNGVLTGRVVSTIDPVEATHTCDKCEDDRRGQKLIGLQIIRDMRLDGDAWTGGSVLDPQTGSIYRGTIRLADDGQKLELRGYIGIPLFGRSQTWLRAQK